MLPSPRARRLIALLVLSFLLLGPVAHALPLPEPNAEMDAVAVAQAVGDNARCAALKEDVPAFDRCELWAARVSSSTGPDDASDIAVGPDGTVFVTGLMDAGYIGVETAAIDPASGVVLWTNVTLREGLSSGEFVAVSPDGDVVFVVGDTNVPGHPRDVLVLAYDARSGEGLWDATYGGSADKPDGPAGAAVTPDGSRLMWPRTSRTQWATTSSFSPTTRRRARSRGRRPMTAPRVARTSRSTWR